MLQPEFQRCVCSADEPHWAVPSMNSCGLCIDGDGGMIPLDMSVCQLTLHHMPGGHMPEIMQIQRQNLARCNNSGPGSSGVCAFACTCVCYGDANLRTTTAMSTTTTTSHN